MSKIDERYQQYGDLFAAGRFEEALRIINQIIDLDGPDTTYYADRGDTYYAMKAYVNAVADYQHTIALYPNGLYARINLGVTYEKLGKFEEALAQYDAAIELQNDSVVAHCNRGDALRLLKRLSEALEAYTLAIQYDPRFPGTYLNRGHIYSRLGRPQEARADYEQAYELGSEDINIAWTVTWALRFGRSPQIETGRLLDIAQLYPGDRHYVFFLCQAVIALLRDEMTDALSAVGQASSMAPDQWDPPFWRAMIAAWIGDYATAQQAIGQAFELGLPPAFLQPLYWLKVRCPLFFEEYASDLLRRLTE
jgi:tetratricopeptide (TPR) repeat protein